MKYTAALALLFTLNQSSALGQAEKPCSAERARFQQMNRGMFVDHTSTAADAASYEKNKDSATEALHQFLVWSISSELGRMNKEKPETAVLVNRIRCIQSGIPYYSKDREFSNLPVAFSLAGNRPLVVVGYSIHRGYTATLQDTHFLEVYVRANADWEVLVAAAPHDFDAATLNISKVNSSAPNDQWFLLTGKRYGDTGGRLFIALLDFDGKALKELWSQVRPRTALVRVLPNGVVVTSEEPDKSGHVREVTKTLLIDERGLKTFGQSP